ncbi:MAG: flagellar protein FliS [Ignavibacteriae bacterium]|nr:flagellar protein FliS [Ignavibacteriota bacterium]MCB9206143.1 flagellar protein FliS [Ignavibacteriales bacterium]MCB9209416.1 flagellar protein FliS [Ignavibacteriales bacterium]MCB9258059.1 flagellar protein FliS [Ignavibacteriales bacterium]
MYHFSAALKINNAHNNYGANAYLANEILNASPQKLLLKVYDFAIAQCKNKNLEKTNKALAELINALRFDDDNSYEISIGLKRLYEYCQDQMRNRNYDIVLRILTELRETWNKVFVSMES